jgi:hypothetical protein
METTERGHPYLAHRNGWKKKEIHFGAVRTWEMRPGGIEERDNHTWGLHKSK